MGSRHPPPPPTPPPPTPTVRYRHAIKVTLSDDHHPRTRPYKTRVVRYSALFAIGHTGAKKTSCVTTRSRPHTRSVSPAVRASWTRMHTRMYVMECRYVLLPLTFISILPTCTRPHELSNTSSKQCALRALGRRLSSQPHTALTCRWTSKRTSLLRCTGPRALPLLVIYGTW